MFDFRTILRAIELVGEYTPAAIQLYEGFIAVLDGKDQDELKARYEAAKANSDDLHQRIQGA